MVIALPFTTFKLNDCDSLLVADWVNSLPCCTIQILKTIV